MSVRPRVVVDTNVLVSALLFSASVPRQAWNKARATGTVLVSADTLAELGEVLHRPKLTAYVTPAESAAFLEALLREAELVTVTERLTASTDPKDDKFLELALAGRADFLITGDRAHLLPLGEYRGTRILAPRAFLDLP